MMCNDSPPSAWEFILITLKYKPTPRDLVGGPFTRTIPYSSYVAQQIFTICRCSAHVGISRRRINSMHRWPVASSGRGTNVATCRHGLGTGGCQRLSGREASHAAELLVGYLLELIRPLDEHLADLQAVLIERLEKGQLADAMRLEHVGG